MDGTELKTPYVACSCSFVEPRPKIMKMIMTTMMTVLRVGHEVKGRWSEEVSPGRERGKEKNSEGEEDPDMLHVYVRRQHDET
jgi:hypothetical protein